ncbi:hypothetical protein [Polyangium sp. 6x1]|uniref:hypothetical protein n=1 Tax=Polyangium sp. 6x1 TaxID=3042689 RepID=UPI0024821F21|nr:hypothetical protein [Polyangium sp. 6x1]MDI1445308.1 hypothetical protein [Polyangium sp. 6x1]
MNKPSMRRRPASTLACLVALSGLTFVLASGCGRSEAATQRGDETNVAAVAKGPKAESDTYAVEMKATGPYAAGKEGSLEITIVPKGAYHMNDQYPYKFKLVDPAPEGVTYPKPLLKREDGTFNEKKGSFKVPFVASRAGKAKIGGTLSMSVCSAANCVMEKVDLEVDVDVK